MRLGACSRDFPGTIYLHHNVVHFNVSGHPTAAWVAKQIREAFPGDGPPRYLIRDRNRVYGEGFRDRA